MISQRELLGRINDAANVVNTSSSRGSANYIIVSASMSRAWYNIINFRIGKIRKIKKLIKNG